MDALYGDCGAYKVGRRYGCSMIGTEYCDWSCPNGGLDCVIASARKPTQDMVMEPELPLHAEARASEGRGK